MKLFVGLHQPSDAKHFDACMVSVNRLRGRISDFPVRAWIMDSGAFTIIDRFGYYPEGVEVYARQIERWRNCGSMLRAASQDYMCEEKMLERTGLSVWRHQQLTAQRYAELRFLTDAPLLPVLQGYEPHDYVNHLTMYGSLIEPGMWVGVGSVCKRNGDPSAIRAVLWSIKQARPDLRLHGFGLKATALASPLVRELLHSADSMAWSYAARKQGRNSNDWREAMQWANPVGSLL